MRLEEIKQGNAAEQHVQQLKTNAKAAKERAKQMKASADQSAEQLKMQQSRQQLSKLHRTTAGTTIQPSV